MLLHFYLRQLYLLYIFFIFKLTIEDSFESIEKFFLNVLPLSQSGFRIVQFVDVQFHA